MSRLKQRVAALESGTDVLSYWDLLELSGYEDDGHIIAWEAALGDQDPRLRAFFDGIVETDEEREDTRRWSSERKQQVAEERRTGIRKPGPVEPRLRRYVTTAV